MIQKPVYALSFCVLVTTGINATVKKQSPNIIFILVDDMGIGDAGCYGQEQIKTPNIDKLASSGMLFSQHYSGSTVSAPSRCALLTGKHTGHGYVRGNIGSKEGFDLALPSEEITVAELLKQKGYATACVGKWGLGGPNTTGSPVNKGFDYFFGYLSQADAHHYYPDYLFENEQKVQLDGKVYSHFMIMDKGIEFMRKNAAKPLFMYFAITPPHADLDYPDISQYDGKFEEPKLTKKDYGSFLNNPKPRATYASMITEIDKNVGQIISELKALNLLDNTIIIFSSDNGVHNVGGHDPEFFNSNSQFRGCKRDLYEGGIRTPFIVNWPKVVKPGTKTNHISAFWDFLPTVCDITGIVKPSNSDGISYLPALKGKTKKQKNHEYIYYEFFEMGGKQSILKDGWKLVRLNLNNPNKQTEELYHLDNDISETTNLITKFPQKGYELRNLAAKARTESSQFKWGQAK